MEPQSPTPAPNRKTATGRRRWPRIVGWIAIVACIAIVAVLAVAVILLHSPRFHRYLLTMAESKASSVLNTPVEIHNFAIHLSNLSVDVYGVTVLGAAPYPQPPLLQVPHVEASLRIVSLLHRKWYLDTLRIDRPVLRVFMDAHGVSNIPKPKSNGESGRIDIFSLGIRHALLDGGEIDYNNKKRSLAADLRDVQFQSSFNPLEKKYDGSLAYSDGQLQMGSFRPIPHSLNVRFTAAPTVFHLTEAKVASGSSQFVLAATLTNYGDPSIQGKYFATLDTGDLGRILGDPSLPSGVVQTRGAIQYVSGTGVPLLNNLDVQGTLKSASLRVTARQTNVPVEAIAATYSLANGNLLVKDFRGRALDGTVQGALAMRDIAGATRSELHATLRGISLAQLQRATPHSSRVRNVALSGTMNAHANAQWGKTLRNLVADLDANIRADVSHRARAAQGISVTGEIHGTWRATQKQLALERSYIQLPQSRLTMNGTVGSNSALNVHFQSSNLGETETVAEMVRPAHSRAAQSLGLGGSASFTGTVRGSISSPRVSGNLSASRLQFKGTDWRTIRATVDASPFVLNLTNADLEPASGGDIALHGRVDLHRWSFTKSSSFQVQMQAAHLQMVQIAKLAGAHRPVTGTLAATLNLHGTETHPIGQGNLSLTKASVDSQSIQSAHLAFTGTSDQIHGHLNVRVLGGIARSAFTFHPDQKKYAVQLNARGIHLDQIEIFQTHNVPVNGVLALSGSGQGTLNRPQFAAKLTVPKLEIQQQPVQGLELDMAVANRVATVNLNSNAIGTSIRTQAKVSLYGEYMVEATLDTRNIPLQPVLAMYVPTEASQLHGETEIHATFRGPLKDPRRIEAHVTIPMLKLGYSDTIQLAATQPLHIDYTNGVLNLQRASIQGTDTNLEVQGAIPIRSGVPASLLLEGTVNLQLAQLFNPDIQSSGELRFNINSYGAAGGNIEGRVDIVNANFSNGSLPLGFQRGNGVLILSRDRLSIQSFSASMGGGTLTAQGAVVYRPSLQFDLAVSANGVRVLYPQGMREEIGANIRLSGTRQDSLLAGRVRIDNMSFTPDFDLANFTGQLSGGVSAPPSQGFAQNMHLNIGVTSTSNLNLVSRTLSIDGTANLQIRGTAAQPVVLGRINLADGDIIFNGNRYTLSGGTIEFVNPSQTEPVLNVALNTTIQQYNIHLRFNGPMDQLRTNYSSDPSLPSADIINLLAFGQTKEYSAANPTPGDQAAMSAVASQVSSQITSRVAKVAGISQLSINPVLAGGSAQGPAGAIVTIQQRVTGNLFVTFSTNVTSTQNQVIMGQYRISPRVSVSVTRDQNGGVALDTIFKKKW